MSKMNYTKQKKVKNSPIDIEVEFHSEVCQDAVSNLPFSSVGHKSWNDVAFVRSFQVKASGQSSPKDSHSQHQSPLHV